MGMGSFGKIGSIVDYRGEVLLNTLCSSYGHIHGQGLVPSAALLAEIIK